MTRATVVFDSPWRTKTRLVAFAVTPTAWQTADHDDGVIHVRIVSSPELLDPVLMRIEGDASIVNVVVVEGAGRRPVGHLVLLDVAEEATNDLLVSLRELGVHQSGSVSIQRAPLTVSDAAEQAERLAPGNPAEAVIWDEVVARAQADATLTLSLLIFMVIAALIAAVGIVTDSPILIVGAMVVSPDYNPLSAATVGMFVHRRALVRRGLTTLATGFAAGVVATIVLSLAVDAIDSIPSSVAFDQKALTAFISRPTLFSAVVALLAGVAGALSLTEARAGALVGVFISVTTIPAVAAIGVHLAAANWPRAWGATVQLLVNVVCLVVAGWATMEVQRRVLTRQAARRV
jgi:uncharacterized hydrophobic protein (TIGR00271 family)